MIKTFVSNSFARFAGLRLVLLSPTAYAVGYRSAARFASFVVVLLTLVALTTCSTHHGEEVDTTAIPEVTVAKSQLGRAEIRAPFAGTVVRRFLGVGDQVDGSGGQPVVEVAAIEALELLGTVPANRLNDIKTGETFKFTTDAAPGATFEARVVAALPAVDPATNNGTVRVRIQNPKRLLKLGQYLSLELPSKESSPRLVVPKQAIYPGESGEPHVYVVKGEEADMVPVVVGAQTGEQAEIISGVSDGDSVIVNGGYGLPEKSKVRVKGSTAQ